jgi:hypothetical protein
MTNKTYNLCNIADSRHLAGIRMQGNTLYLRRHNGKYDVIGDVTIESGERSTQHFGVLGHLTLFHSSIP